VHLDIALHHHYVDRETFEALDDACDKIIAQIIRMIDEADRWIIRSSLAKRRPPR
jgi:hypothetical protein